MERRPLHELETWSPFQSVETREICAHLTPAELSAVLLRSRRYGRCCAFTFALPLAFAVVAGMNFGRSIRL